MSDRMILKDRLKKLGLFCLIVFIPVLVVAVVLYSVGVPEWANMLVLVVMLLALFCVFMYVCSVVVRKTHFQSSKENLWLSIKFYLTI